MFECKIVIEHETQTEQTKVLPGRFICTLASVKITAQ